MTLPESVVTGVGGVVIAKDGNDHDDDDVEQEEEEEGVVVSDDDIVSYKKDKNEKMDERDQQEIPSGRTEDCTERNDDDDDIDIDIDVEMVGHEKDNDAEEVKNLLANDDDEDDDDDEDEKFATLTENTYSILFVANPKDRAFYVAIIFFFFQAALPTLALLNLIDTASGNLFQIPVNADRTVHAAGFFALTLSVPYFPDLLDSIERFHIGYHPTVLQQCPYATWK